jgi:large subunit ribosomal protein L23
MKRNNDPFQIIKHRHVTEKSTVLEQLKDNQSNRSVRACESPKYVFIVDKKANKPQIAKALEEIYKENKIRVVKVNTITLPPKVRRVRGRIITQSGFKKAVVTLEKGDEIAAV